jgi:predicted DNA-binding antitoxin AbrB/MazE fold protein
LCVGLVLGCPSRNCYENGFLKPAKPLKLRQGEKVAVVVLRHPDPARWDMKRLAVGSTEDETLASAGLDAWADALDAEDRR